MRNILLLVLLVLSTTPACTFATFPRERHIPDVAAFPPCFTGDVCPDGLVGLRSFH